MQSGWKELFILLAAMIAFGWVHLYRRQWKPSRTAHGRARTANWRDLKRAGFFNRFGFVLARTKLGVLLQVPDTIFSLLVAPPGAGKTVSLIIPNLLKWVWGSVIALDVKGELFAITAAARQRMGDRVVRLAPFSGGLDCLNPLDWIRAGALMIDQARALAAALIVRTGLEHEAHWSDVAEALVTAVIVFVIHTMKAVDRNLITVRDIACDYRELLKAACKLIEMGGVEAAMGHQVFGLFTIENGLTVLSKEGVSVVNTAVRNLTFLMSDLVAVSVTRSTFNPADLAKPGIAAFIQIPPEMQQAQRGLLRMWTHTIIQAVCAAGNWQGQTFFALDECATLGNLPALEQLIQLGRAGGAKALLVYQSDALVRAAFRDKPTLLHDGCSTQIYMGVTTLEEAQKISGMIGQKTIVVECDSDNESRGWSRSAGQHGDSISENHGGGRSRQVQGRPLLRPEEILRLPSDLLICFHRGVPPIIARRIKWYEDREFASQV
jgi:type IV secretion system protein VirD4